MISIKSINELSLLFSKETIINKNVNLFQIGLFDNFNFYEEFVNQCNSDFDHFIEVIHYKLQNEF